jgi:hypothetical protein
MNEYGAEVYPNKNGEKRQPEYAIKLEGYECTHFNGRNATEAE